MLFTSMPSHPVRVRVYDEQGQPTTAGFLIRDEMDRIGNGSIRPGRTCVSDGQAHLFDFSGNGVEAGTRDSEVRLDRPGRVNVTLRAAAKLEDEPNESIHRLPYDEKPYWDIERAWIGKPGTRHEARRFAITMMPWIRLHKKAASKPPSVS